MEYHLTVNKIKDLLQTNNIEFETFEHTPVRTSEEASKIRTGYTLEQGAKAIIAKVKEGEKGKRFVMFVFPAHKRFDSTKLKENLGFTQTRFATESEVSEITNGVLPGGVPPFGNLFGLDVFVDKSLFDNERIVFNAGDRSFSIGMKSEDYSKVVNPVVVDIVE